MIHHLQHFLSRPAHRRRPTVDMRARSVLTRVEHLETRCLLSASPGAEDLAGDLWAPPIELEGSATVVMPLPSYLGDGLDADAVKLQHRAHARHVEGSPSRSHDSSSSDGFIDIGEPFQAGPADLSTSRDASQDLRDVEQVLSSLRYLPRNSHDEAIGSLYGGNAENNPEGRLARKSAQSAAPSTAGSADRLAPSAAGDAPQRATLRSLDVQPSEGVSQEGGMVELTREVVIDDSVTIPMNARVDADPAMSVPVQMDGAYGRFQAFEVSTAKAEETSSSSPPPASPVSEARTPFTGAAAASAAQSQATLGPQQVVVDEIRLADLQSNETSRSAVARKVIDAGSSGATAEWRDRTSAVKLPPAARVPSDDEARSHALVKVTAAAAAFAIAARIAQPTSTRLPNERPERDTQWDGMPANARP